MAFITKGSIKTVENPSPDTSTTSNISKEVSVPSTLTYFEVTFIIEKLQQSTYKGIDFEDYYNVMKKLLEIQRILK